jgi:hypothetical protein
MEKRRNYYKIRPVGPRYAPYGYEFKYVNYNSPWSRTGGPEVTTKFFLREESAKEYAETFRG